jgi:hypothetical protein
MMATAPKWGRWLWRRTGTWECEAGAACSHVQFWDDSMGCRFALPLFPAAESYATDAAARAGGVARATARARPAAAAITRAL